MARTINFVRERQRNLSKLEEQDKKIFRTSLIGVGGILAVAIIVICIRLFILYQVSRVTEEQKNFKTAISAQEQVERSFTVFVHKLKTLTELFGKRKEKQETLSYFSSLFNSDVIISQLSYTSTTEELLFTLQAKDVFVLKRVIDTLNSAEVKERFPKIAKSNLRRGSAGEYSMNIQIPLGDKPLEERDENGNIIPASNEGGDQNVDEATTDTTQAP